MAGNRYLDEEIPASEEAGRALAATAKQPGAEPLAAGPATPAVDPGSVTATFTPGGNRYLDENAAQPPVAQVQLSGESAEAPDARMEQYKQLPDLWSAPAASPLRSIAGFTAFATNSGADQVEKILRANNPGTTVEHDNGARIYTFPGDPQKYAWVPGMQPSDIARAVPGVIGNGLIAAATGGTSIPAQIVGNVVQSLLGEGAKKLVGGDAEGRNVAMAAAIPPAFEGMKWLGGKTAGVVGGIISRAAAPRGQKADTLVDPLVQAGKDLMVKLGAKPDLSELAQDVAGVTQPMAEAAQRAASQAAANTETATAAAAAKAEADTLAAQTAAKDALDAAKTTAGDATTKVTNQLQDSVAAVGANAEAAKAAASAPVDSVVDGTIQALQKWGAGETSSLDKKFLSYSMGVLDKLEKSAAVLYKKLEDGFPKDARIQPGKAFQELQEWLDGKLTGRNPSKFLQQVKKDTGLEEVGNAVRMPQVADITRAKQRASDIGHAGVTELADISKGEAKHVASLLEKVEDQAARDHGMGGLLDDAQAAWSKRQTYRDELDKVLTLRGEKALRDGTLVPALDAAGSAVQKGNLLPLKQIMTAAPPGMKQELMAAIVNRTVDPSKGPEHMVTAIDAIRKSPEANELVFSNLPSGARKQLLGLGADMERTLAKREADIVAAEAAKKAETTALRRGAAAGKRSIRAAADAEKRMARETETAALRKIAGEKADTVATAKIGEQAATEAAVQAKRLDIALAPELRSAGRALFNGDIRPFDGMLKSAPGRKGELAASTLYHGLFDPADTGPEALRRMTEGLAKLEASPVALRRIKSLLPNATSDIEAVTDLARVVYSGTAAGGRRVEGVLNALASMGPWAAGRTAGTAAGVGTGLAGGGLATSAATGLGATVLGRMLASRFAKDSTIETKAANAFLASNVGRGLLKRFSLDKPITQGYMNWLATSRPVQAIARVYGMRPERFIRKLAYGSEHVLREAGEQAITPNDTKEEE